MSAEKDRKREKISTATHTHTYTHSEPWPNMTIKNCGKSLRMLVLLTAELIFNCLCTPPTGRSWIQKLLRKIISEKFYFAKIGRQIIFRFSTWKPILSDTSVKHQSLNLWNYWGHLEKNKFICCFFFFKLLRKKFNQFFFKYRMRAFLVSFLFF